MSSFIRSIALLLFVILIPQATEASTPKFRFNELTVSDGLCSNDVRKIYQDKEGYIWVLTTTGLSRYDGYEFFNYKSNLYNRELLQSNNLTDLVEDGQNNLWVASESGIEILNKRLGTITQIPPQKLDNRAIQVLMMGKDGVMWIGSTHGLYQYIAEKDTFMLLTQQNSGFTGHDIKSIIEDANGHVWIGTWSQGLHRYDPLNKTFHKYPQMNPRNSAHVIYQDSKSNIWVGSWESGLFRLINPYYPSEVESVNYQAEKGKPNHLADNTIYAITEDLNTGYLWIGTKGGVSILKETLKKEAFENIQVEMEDTQISHIEVNSIIRSRDNIIWLGLLGGGVNWVDTRTKHFVHHNRRAVNEKTVTNIQSLMLQGEDSLWLGVASYGLLLHDRKKDEYTHYSKLPDFKEYPYIPTINAIIKRKQRNETWFASFDMGVFCYQPTLQNGRRLVNLNTENTPWLASDRTHSLMEDWKGNLWIGTANGFSILDNKGKGHQFDTLNLMLGVKQAVKVHHMVEDLKHTVWLATNLGLFSTTNNSGQIETMTFQNYSIQNNRIKTNNISSLVVDKQNRLWVGTDGEGLCLYNAQKGVFETVHDLIPLPGDAIYSMIQDDDDFLWIASNGGFVKLKIQQDINQTYCRIYSETDGLQGFYFKRNAVYKSPKGELFFGGYLGYNSFFPNKLQDYFTSFNVVITDVKIFNSSLYKLEKEHRLRISKESAGFTQTLLLDYENNFAINFSLLSYGNPEQNKFAYKLVGFDKEWHYTNASSRTAYYNNLKSGKYTFLLKGANEGGEWKMADHTLTIIISPPWWLSWWAFILYLLFIGSISYVIYRWINNRLRYQKAINDQELKRIQVEEVNQVKLQFFTNITHEFLTPLSVITSSIDDLLQKNPSQKEIYNVINNNARRLIRLLQQILEFRKAETGNLKLSVSKGEIVAFIAHTVESTQPLFRKKKINFSLHSKTKECVTYFDTDKLDKILYNLLSNAAKYNRPDGKVEIHIDYNKVEELLTIVVKDNGIGMDQEVRQNLFKRFHEGSFRQAKTSGTGIGLSLTKDLVELHHGVISVDSVLDEGTVFTITIPTDDQSYQHDRLEVIDESMPERENEPDFGELMEEDEATTILFVEDNEELLGLMCNLFIPDYRVLKAISGEEALIVLKKNRVDVIVSDIMMDQMDGIELCKFIKASDNLQHIPVILLTAKQTNEDRIEAYNSGADGYINKPFELELLQARIHNLLKKQRNNASNFRKQVSLEINELDYKTVDEQFLNRAIACIAKHIDDPDFDQLMFMQEMGTSRSTLYAKLKTLTGLNSSSFIRNVRLKAACQIMKKNRTRIAEVASAVGFNDPKYFSSCFKKEYGILPSEYRDQLHTDPFPDEKQQE